MCPQSNHFSFLPLSSPGLKSQSPLTWTNSRSWMESPGRSSRSTRAPSDSLWQPEGSFTDSSQITLLPCSEPLMAPVSPRVNTEVLPGSQDPCDLAPTTSLTTCPYSLPSHSRFTSLLEADARHIQSQGLFVYCALRNGMCCSQISPQPAPPPPTSLLKCHFLREK